MKERDFIMIMDEFVRRQGDACFFFSIQKQVAGNFWSYILYMYRLLIKTFT